MRISETHPSIPLIAPANYGSAGAVSASPNTGLFHSLSLFLSFGSITGNSVLTLYAGATQGAQTTALPFTYRIAAAATGSAGADVLDAAYNAVTSAGLTLTAGTFASKQVAIEVDSDQMTDGQPWLTISISNVATTLYVEANGICTPRYPGNTPPASV